MTEKQATSETEKLTADFQRALDSHGYGFQHAVFQTALRLRQDGKSPWIPSVMEFPVSVQSDGTRVDVILQHETARLYLIGECKRVNPALSNWCFIRAPFLRSGTPGTGSAIEMLGFDDRGIQTTAVPYNVAPDDVYHVALEVKTNLKGDPCSSGRGEIESASTQVCRALNGMINLFGQNSRLFDLRQGMGFLPVIFTTANLFVSQGNLEQADVETGKLDISNFPLKPSKWLYYHYPQSPGLKHSILSGDRSRTLQDILYHTYVKTIAIVSADGIPEFLSQPIDLVQSSPA